MSHEEFVNELSELLGRAEMSLPADVIATELSAQFDAYSDEAADRACD